MGRAAEADVLGGWEGMVPASPDHARCPRRALPRPCAPESRGRVFLPREARKNSPFGAKVECPTAPRMHAGDGIG